MKLFGNVVPLKPPSVESTNFKHVEVVKDYSPSEHGLANGKIMVVIAHS